MRIVFVTTGLSTGGAEIMLLKLLERLDHRFCPLVISLTSVGEIGERIVALGIPVVALGMRRNAAFPLGAFRLYRELKRFRPDIVQTWMYHADLLGGAVAKAMGKIRIVWNVRNSTLDVKRSRATTRLTAWACARISSLVPDRIVCCSTATQRVHETLGYDAKRLLIIPNGFDLERFRPDAEARVAIRKLLGLSEVTILIGLIGRFDPQKNHVGFIEAASQVHRLFPEVHFVMAGNGVVPDNRELAKAIVSRGLAPAMHLLGIWQDMPQLMAALDVLASSAIYGEAFPNVIGEAMACGVPCAVTDVGDSALIVGETGRVVMPGDISGLSRVLIELLALPVETRRNLGARARSRIGKHYAIGDVALRYEALYSELSEAAWSHGGCGDRDG